MRSIWHLGFLALVSWLMASGDPALARVQKSAKATVSIRIEPTAEISLPQGSRFFIVVPHPDCSAGHQYQQHGCWLWSQRWWPPILPVRIPFIVKGNAAAVVSVRPDAFLRIRSGRYLGKALRSDGKALGYHVIIHFPAPDESYHWVLDWTGWSDWSIWNNWGGYGYLPLWSHFAQLPGLNSAWTAPITASMIDRHGTAYGVIYVVAAYDWTADGSRADPGNYYGSVEVTVTAAQ